MTQRLGLVALHCVYPLFADDLCPLEHPNAFVPVPAAFVDPEEDEDEEDEDEVDDASDFDDEEDDDEEPLAFRTDRPYMRGQSGY